MPKLYLFNYRFLPILANSLWKIRNYESINPWNNSIKHFSLTAHSHTNIGCGCPKCSDTTLTKEDWIKKAIEVHGNVYDKFTVMYTIIRKLFI